MTTLADTNIFIRHLTGDPPEQAARATAYLASADLIVLPDLILAEIVYVLESFYRVPRNRTAQAARSLIAFNNVKVTDPSLLLRTIEIYEIHRIDFADAYIPTPIYRRLYSGLRRDLRHRRHSHVRQIHQPRSHDQPHRAVTGEQATARHRRNTSEVGFRCGTDRLGER